MCELFCELDRLAGLAAPYVLIGLFSLGLIAMVWRIYTPLFSKES
jgi:hypothetical protein